MRPLPSLHLSILTCAEELPVRLAHRVKELDELPHNLSAMPSINKVKNWYAQSFEASPFPQNIRLFITSQQELITFPPIVLPLSIRQALMVSRSDDINFPESKPNPSQARFVDPNLHNNPNSNSFNKLKLRVPMERRYPSCSFPPCLSFHRTIDITPTLTASIGHPKYKITINDSPKC